VSRFHKLNRSRKARLALLTGGLSLVTAAAFVAPAAAIAPIGPVPAPANAVTLSASPTTGLTDGSIVTFSVNTTGSTKLIGNLTAHLCQDGFTSYSSGTFGYSGASATRCVYSPGIVSGGLTGADYEKTFGPFAGTEATSGSLTFNVGTGSLVWGNVTGQGPLSLTADSTHAVDLVLEVNLAGDANTATTYFIQPLTFAGPLSQPDPPTGVTASSGDATSHVSWTAPANTGNGTIDHYVITATPTSGSDVTTHTLDVGTALSGNIPLQSFSTYNITVHDHISAGSTPTSAESSPVVSVSPLPPGPTGVSGTGGSGQVNVSWTAPASSQTGLTQYEVTATGGPTPIVQLTGSLATSLPFTGLANGTPYTFVVRADYGASAAGPYGLPSNASAAVVPSNLEIDQLIEVTRPQGALVLTQACDPSFPTPVYPTSPGVAGTPGAPGACSVDLGTAALVTTAGVPGPGYPSVGAGQFYEANGALHQVTVSDTRDGDTGWNVNGVLETPFTAGSQEFSADQLGWQPAVTDKTASFEGYTNAATAGGQVLPAVQLSDHALGSAQTLASAAAGGGLGVAHLDATLHLLIPIFVPHGAYGAVLQITAI